MCDVRLEEASSNSGQVRITGMWCWDLFSPTTDVGQHHGVDLVMVKRNHWQS